MTSKIVFKSIFLFLACCIFPTLVLAEKNIPPKPQSMPILLQTVNVTKDLQIQYRYFNNVLKYIAIKNTGKPVEISILEQIKVLGTDETYVLAPPKGVTFIRLVIFNYASDKTGGDLISMDKIVNKQKDVLILLPEAPQSTQTAPASQPAR